MSSDNATYCTVMGMCQMMLKQKQVEQAAASGGFLSAKDILDVVDQLISIPTFSGVDKDRLAAELQERFTVVTGRHQTLVGDNDIDHVPWLHSRRAAITWRFWDRYYLFMMERIPKAAMESIDRVTNEVLEHIEDPQRAGFWDSRGLVMGHVQSGKTANYTGLICKAADAGYKVVIVLSGIHNSLRSQTQIRLEEGFLGYMRDAASLAQTLTKLVGVGEIDSGEKVRADTITNRTEKGDFNEAVAKHFAIHPGGRPLLFVVKKHVGVLANLIKWIRSYADGEDESGRKYVRNVPALVIDDEGDIASVDTKQQAFDESGKPDDDHDPVKTNRNIRLLLRSFEKVAYVAYTATPFANIYIHNAGYTRELGPDLFPRNFIVNITAPSNYMGASRIFGLGVDSEAGVDGKSPLPIVRHVSDHADSDEVDETRGWMPPRLVARTEHLPRYKGEDAVPPSMREAIMAFLLAVAIRRLREPGPQLNTMLIHVVRYTLVQKKVADQVTLALREIHQRLRNGDGARKPTIFDEFERLWREDFVVTTKSCREILGLPLAEVTWDSVRRQLEGIAAGIKVKVINGSAGDVLDYEEHRKTGLDVIAIGGDKLSRGLTLDGLSVSYFLRASRMYDTLMQMGRWFGYREKYVDVCRLYTTSELQEWFAHIAAASEELQREFEYMESVGGTPNHYGLKVLSHPVMLVTSSVKMRNGVEMPLSYRRSISESIKFSNDELCIGDNLKSAEAWLSSLGKARESEGGSHHMWSATARQVLDFLCVYKMHDHELGIMSTTSLLSKYIGAKVKDGELVNWSVGLVYSGFSGAARQTVAGIDMGLISRAPYPISRAPYPSDAQRKDIYSIKRLVNPSDECLDLNDEQRQSALIATIERWRKSDSPRKAEEEPTRPNGFEARLQRDPKNGLLLLYPLDPRPAGLRDDLTIIGLAISFPDSTKKDDITYTVNNVFTTRGGDDDSL